MEIKQYLCVFKDLLFVAFFLTVSSLSARLGSNGLHVTEIVCKH